jgi:CheY-like chemotaxis protein/anti-sigma regulatory factor (Ser/Thr protein kinase)
LARIEGGKLQLDVKPLRWGDTLQEVCNLFALQAADKGLQFVFDAPPDLPLVVRADERRLRQILINLLGNAVKFTAAGSVTFRVRHAREMASFEISDTGPGMSEAMVQRVFEPFERGSSSVGTTGAGLGLTIAKMLVDLMGGELRVSTQEGQGTSFVARVFLPEVREMSRAADLSPAKRIGYEGQRRSILVVDNEETDRQLLADRLQALGFVTQQASSGEDALRQLQEGLQPDVIFMDLAMPGRDGWQTIAAIREQALSQAHIAIVSANAFDKTLDNAVGITPQDFFVKPIRWDELLDWIGLQLNLLWISEHSAQDLKGLEPKNALKKPAAEPTVIRFPPKEVLQTLLQHAQLGYYRGISAVLQELPEQDYSAFISRVQAWLKTYQFDAIANFVQEPTP